MQTIYMTKGLFLEYIKSFPSSIVKNNNNNKNPNPNYPIKKCAEVTETFHRRYTDGKQST